MWSQRKERKKKRKEKKKMKKKGEKGGGPCAKSALEVEGQEVKFLQLNLGRWRDAQDLLMQTARERGPMCCSLVSSTNGLKTLFGFRMHQGGPASFFVALI